MKILFYLSRYPGVGGIENVTTLIVDDLLKDSRGEISIDIISHIQEDANVTTSNCSHLFVMPDAGKYHTKENLLYAERIISDGGYNAIVYQDSYAPTEKIVCELCKKYKIPLYVFEHNSPLFIYNKRGLDPITTVKGFLRRVLHPYLLYKEKIRKRYLYDCCDKYILLSKYYISEFCDMINVIDTQRKIVVINNPIRELEDISLPKENIVLCVSRLVKEKQVDKLLEIWLKTNDYLRNWKLVIVGDGPQRSRLENYVKCHNIQSVQFTGFIIPFEYYSRAKVFAMTSKFEGWPLTLVEAMHYGCVPIVWQAFSSLEDIIKDNYNGIIVTNGNKEEFAQELLRLCGDENLNLYSQRAQKETLRFEKEKIIYQWKKLLNFSK